MSDEEKIKELELIKKKYEENGGAKLYYALNRKMWEMADMLNANSLSNINLDDAKDKSFDRIFRILEKSETVGNSAKALREFAGITNDESYDIGRTPFKITSPESIANVLGNTAGQQS